MVKNNNLSGLFFDRDLSWLKFNDRVLEEAANSELPVLERLRFAAIVSSNLNEFFMVRVAEDIKLALRYPNKRGSDGLTAMQRIVLIREAVLRQKGRQSVIINDIFNSLRRHSIIIYSEFKSLKNLHMDSEIRSKIFPLQIMTRRLSEPLPEITKDKVHVFVKFPQEYAIISLKNREQRLLRIDSSPDKYVFAMIDKWICDHLTEIFPGKDIIEAFPFMIICEHRLRYPLNDNYYLEEYLERQSEQIKKTKIIRLEVDAPQYSEGAMFLASLLGLNSFSLYCFNMPLDIRSLFTIYSLKEFKKLKYPPISPVPLNKKGSVMNIMESHDILLHHPYDSFDIVINFIKEAAKDPTVTEIFHSVYRAGKYSPVIESLKEAAGNGKKVTCYVELKARFDEFNNLRWIQELRKANVNVIPPFNKYKVHSKVTQVVKQIGNRKFFYTHLGTGNYNVDTAQQYTDLGLLTCDKNLGMEVNRYFNMISGYKTFPHFRLLMVSPYNLYTSVIRLIHREISFHKRYGRGEIKAKMNSLVDTNIINALYEASTCGVKINLLVRGICCLKPGIKGISENIRVVSVVDRFLEHSRIYYFGSGGEGKLYLSSADWMPRNLYGRFEIAFPVLDPLLKKYIKEDILDKGLYDNVKSWYLLPDGRYIKIKPSHGEPPIRSQEHFIAISQRFYKGTVLEDRLNH